MTLLIAKSILVSVGQSRVLGTSHQGRNVSVVSHFQIDADSAIKRRPRNIKIKICNSCLNDTGKKLASLLIMSNSNFYSMAWVEFFTYRRWKIRLCAWRKLVEAVTLTSVCIEDGYSLFGLIGILGMSFCDLAVEIVVEGLMLSLDQISIGPICLN